MSKILYCDQFEYSTDQLAQAAWLTDAAGLELDYMEYANDGLAQAAYVSSDTTPSLIDSYSEANQAIDLYLNSTGDQQLGQSFTLASDIVITSLKWYLKKVGTPPGNMVAKLYAATGTVGSTAIPTGSILATSDTIVADTLTTSYVLIEFTFSTPYSASAGDYCILVEYSSGDGSNSVIVGDDSTSPTHAGNMFYTATPGSGWGAAGTHDLCFYLYGGSNLQCYSEDTIVNQGSYSLKAVAKQTGSLNDTLTKTLIGEDKIDLTGISTLKFDVYASRTGTNLQMQIHDSGGQTSTKDIAISSADEWETITWDISAIDDTDKDDIDKIIIKVIEASADNTFYVDNFITPEALQCYSEDTIKQQGSYSLRVIAIQSNSLNKTLTKTLTDYLDYSIMDVIKLEVRASRTGSNIKLKIHDTGGTTSEHTINIASADTWQTETWDISGIAVGNRDTIDKIIIEIINADAINTLYFDNMYSKAIVETSHVFLGG